MQLKTLEGIILKHHSQNPNPLALAMGCRSWRRELVSFRWKWRAPISGALCMHPHAYWLWLFYPAWATRSNPNIRTINLDCFFCLIDEYNWESSNWIFTWLKNRHFCFKHVMLQLFGNITEKQPLLLNLPNGEEYGSRKKKKKKKKWQFLFFFRETLSSSPFFSSSVRSP